MAGYPAPAELRETHTGLVVLCGDRAYKIKKSIRTDFLDFSTPQRREHACARELTLNRRLAPDIYLGVAHLSDPGGGPDEPVLVMRRLPESSRLSHLLDDPARGGAGLSALARRLADFHDTARRGADIDAEGTRTALRARWRVLLHSLAAAPAALADPATVNRIDRLAMRYLDGRAPLLDRRIAEGRIVDGHGDLQAEDIFELADGFRVLDCLDFDDRLRFVDRLDDVAFLAMDLEFRGHRELADRFLADYQRITTDSAPGSLRDHYIAYRAMVRAKVDSIRFGQGDSAARERTRRHLELAHQHLIQGTVRLALVGGLPGTGKSTVARELSTTTGATVLAADHIRTTLRANGIITGASGTFDAGAYSASARARVYTELLDMAAAALRNGESVILDASWIDPAQRRRAADLATATCAELIALHCRCPSALAQRRIRERTGSESEATPQIAAAMSAIAADWPGAAPVDTGRPITESTATALRVWEQAAQTGASRDLSHRFEGQLRYRAAAGAVV